MTPLDSDSEPTEALGVSDAFLTLQERISRAAKTDRPVILIGERGTGKELAAARLHRLSFRWKNPYITLNCASLTPTLIESELFGHEAGAFTGAVRRRKGRFELAATGTLFLDEIADIPLPVQDKILRVVEYGRMERVGGMETVRADVRLVAAANVDLRLRAKEGLFREDLLDRLSFEVITLPPLRRRREDIPLLVRHFARKMASEMNQNATPEFTEQAMTTLLDHPWPGNVRELKNVVERMVYRALCEEGPPPTIDQIVFDPFESEDAPVPRLPAAPRAVPMKEAELASARSDHAGNELFTLPLPDAVELLERRRIESALEQARYNQRKAAELLGITYHQFRNHYKKHSFNLPPRHHP